MRKKEQERRRKNREREERRKVLSGMEITYLKKIVFEILIYRFLYPSYGKKVACLVGPVAPPIFIHTRTSRCQTGLVADTYIPRKQSGFRFFSLLNSWWTGQETALIFSKLLSTFIFSSSDDIAEKKGVHRVSFPMPAHSKPHSTRPQMRTL